MPLIKKESFPRNRWNSRLDSRVYADSMEVYPFKRSIFRSLSLPADVEEAANVEFIKHSASSPRFISKWKSFELKIGTSFFDVDFVG